MAGVMMTGDEGIEARTQQVPTIGGTDGVAPTATVAASVHLTDAQRAEGVAYNTDESIGTDLDTGGYPSGTAMKDATPGDPIN